MLNIKVKLTAKATLFCILLFIAGSISSLAQTDTWVQKNDFGNNGINVPEPTARNGAIGFSIGSKGYIGTGYADGIGYSKDFWEYDPVANTWMQKADFGGTGRWRAVGFSIGSKGYLGTGYSYSGTNIYYKDFWEYNSIVNTWTQKADFSGTARWGAVGFSIGSKGYLGTGNSGYPDYYKKDFWEYDPAANKWTQKADFSGTARAAAVGFSIGSKGYMGTGDYNGLDYVKDFWEYDPSANAWTQKMDLGDTFRAYAVGFSIGSKGYLGTGAGDDYYKDFWEYDPVANAWTQKADFGGTARSDAIGFSIASKGYLGTGGTKDLWEYDPVANTWAHRETPRGYAVGFCIGSKGYLGTGYAYGVGYIKNFWEYDLVANTWMQKADFMGIARGSAVGFSIGSKGYLGTGESYDAAYYNYKDFWEYDPAANNWIQKADFGGTARSRAVGFSIGSKGYLGTGYTDGVGYTKDFWEYDPAANKWTQKADFGGIGRDGAVSFNIGSKGYIGTGYDGNYTKKDFWEYDPVVNNWIQKADFGGTARSSAVGFSIGSKGYLGTGSNTYKDFWEYDPAVNKWIQKADFEGTARSAAVGFSLGNKGYLGTGKAGINYTFFCKDFWEYTPDNTTCPLATNLSATNITSSSTKLKWNAAPGAEAYRLRYKPLHFGNWTDKATPETSKKVTGLLPGTAYRWEVKTYCHKDPPQVTSDGSAKGEFTTAALSISNEDVQQVSFQMYPVPAKDILHIQTNGNASFSLVNQVGKILATKNINGSGTINVAGIAAGLYYLKNNSSGAVQKVVIAR